MAPLTLSQLSTSKQGFSGVLIHLSFSKWLQACVPRWFIHLVGGINILNMGGYWTGGLQQAGPGWIRSGGIKTEIRNLTALLRPVSLTVGDSGGLTIVPILWKDESPHWPSPSSHPLYSPHRKENQVWNWADPALVWGLTLINNSEVGNSPQCDEPLGVVINRAHVLPKREL